MKKLSIVIPVYNEDSTVEQVVKKVQQVVLPGIKKEIIIVNDGSTDATKDKITKLARGQIEIKTYNSIINLGKGAAVRIGLAKSTGDIIIIQDADLELDPNEYQNILQPILSGETKVVFGSRFLGNNSAISLKTRLVNWLITNSANLLYFYHLTDIAGAYKAFTRDSLKGIRLRALGFEFEAELSARLCQRRFKIIEVPVSYRPRTADQGKKLKLKDGIEAAFTLLRCRLF